MVRPDQEAAWLGNVNPDWDGNYFVQYWQPAWQALMFGSPEAYLDIIIAQGFDGVYLDRADAFLNWEKTRPTAEADMATFLRRLTNYARQRNPDFLVVMQNAEDLLDNPQVLDSIDPVKLTATAKRIVDDGFVPYFAPRQLTPAVPLPDLPLPCR